MERIRISTLNSQLFNLNPDTEIRAGYMMEKPFFCGNSRAKATAEDFSLFLNMAQ